MGIGRRVYNFPSSVAHVPAAFHFCFIFKGDLYVICMEIQYL